ncbi:sulfatase-like hydrolase/transferase [Roseiconus nitratireducens]|uniref:Sulfatase-like hydrolase/transferase n=1 Tax=Roseiconus nitratireducens TaxID=2605748 RepID=A0A5M6DLE7_9BACT|nr:sulfatase-like hydrolase/transferase [Roseiconus nitratireducens]KAA5547226.1 sulfatase-like hydrolase/transferase [Roseiconus nitratireducens]
MSLRISFHLLLGVLLWSAPQRCLVAAPTRPNIIVFYTDDHGHADLSCQQVVDDVRTPNVDALAASGVRMVHGYSTAPQCVPSRGGLLVGRFQGRFGLDSNGSSLDGFNAETTIAERLQQAGYVTAQFGKWHLGPTDAITDHGFRHVFAQNAQRPFSANITLDGEDRPMRSLPPTMYHVDGCSRAAASIIDRYKNQPFFLYIAYRAPHVPLDAPQKYLDRFPDPMPHRRRQALAMLSAVDDGVGLVTDTLKRHGLTEKTLIFYIGDNGAPLKIHKVDAPGGGPGWDGSLNDPLNGEKGMLAEGGMHVPFVVAWPGTIPTHPAYPHPVSALDVAATSAALAGLDVPPEKLDGVNLVPFLTGEKQGPPHQQLMWRWTAQSAIRSGDWKLLRGGEREYLYNLADDLEEHHNLASEHADVAARLRRQLAAWGDQLTPPGLQVGPMSETWNDYFDFYLDGKPAPPLPEKFRPRGKDASSATELRGWLLRDGQMSVVDGHLQISPKADEDHPFLVKNGLSIEGPVTAEMEIRSDSDFEGTFAWRKAGDRTFPSGQRSEFSVRQQIGWQTVRVDLPVQGKLIHLRVHLDAAPTSIRRFQLRSANDQAVTLW